jgi:hypothetical protein
MGEILSDRQLCETGGRVDVRICRRQPRPVFIHSSLEARQGKSMEMGWEGIPRLTRLIASPTKGVVGQGRERNGNNDYQKGLLSRCSWKMGSPEICNDQRDYLNLFAGD